MFSSVNVYCLLFMYQTSLSLPLSVYKARDHTKSYLYFEKERTPLFTWLEITYLQYHSWVYQHV